MKDYVYAGFWIRVGANLIDLIILIIVYIFSYWLLTLVFSDLLSSSLYYMDVDKNIRQGNSFLKLWDVLFQNILPFIATIWFWLKFQATPGKMATNLRLVDSQTGNTISKKQSIGRYFAQIISLVPFGVGYFWIALDKRNQSWHDKLAGTVVIRNRKIEKVVFEKQKKETKET